jgi:hypothetical protein
MATSTILTDVDSGAYVAESQAGKLIQRISEMVQDLEAEMRHPERKELLREIRELRLALASLEFELRSEEHDRLGAAC